VMETRVQCLKSRRGPAEALHQLQRACVITPQCLSSLEHHPAKVA
jgi:hypothetical protein